MTAVVAFFRRLVFAWVAEDPSPTYSTLDKLDGRR